MNIKISAVICTLINDTDILAKIGMPFDRLRAMVSEAIT
jgi:hypothetical protein